MNSLRADDPVVPDLNHIKRGLPHGIEDESRWTIGVERTGQLHVNGPLDSNLPKVVAIEFRGNVGERRVPKHQPALSPGKSFDHIGVRLLVEVSFRNRDFLTSGQL